MKKTILFDIDGTLLLAHSAGSSIIRNILHNEFGREYLEPDQLQLGGRTDKGILTELFQRMEIPLEDASFEKFQRSYLPALKEKLQDNAPTVLPGVKTLLEKLRQDERFEIGLITGNMKEGAEIKLKACGLSNYFQFGGFGDSHCKRDDVAAIAVSEAEKYIGSEFDSNAVTIIGDTVADITCARSVGAKAIAVLTGAGIESDLRRADPDHLLENLEEATNFLFAAGCSS